MQHNKRRAQSRSKINCLERLLNRALAFLRINSGKLIAVGRSGHDFDRQRTKVMQTAEANFAGIEHLLDSWHERDANTMAQLNQLEPELALDLAQHCVASIVAAGVPTGGKGNH